MYLANTFICSLLGGLFLQLERNCDIEIVKDQSTLGLDDAAGLKCSQNTKYCIFFSSSLLLLAENSIKTSAKCS